MGRGAGVFVGDFGVETFWSWEGERVRFTLRRGVRWGIFGCFGERERELGCMWVRGESEGILIQVVG